MDEQAWRIILIPVGVALVNVAWVYGKRSWTRWRRQTRSARS